MINMTTRQVAELAGVDGSTVRRWVERGTLVPSMKLPGGHYRFSREAVMSLLTPAAPAVESSDSVVGASSSQGAA